MEKLVRKWYIRNVFEDKIGDLEVVLPDPGLFVYNQQTLEKFIAEYRTIMLAQNRKLNGGKMTVEKYRQKNFVLNLCCIKISMKAQKKWYFEFD